MHILYKVTDNPKRKIHICNMLQQSHGAEMCVAAIT